MASPASRKRNTARMDGNAAYDLRSTAAEEYLYSTAPVDLPHAPRPTETVVPESAPRPKQAIAPMAVLGFAIAAVLIVFSLVARVQLSQASAQVSALEDQYAELQEQQTRLRIDYESAFNLTEIETTPSMSSVCKSRAAISSTTSAAATPRIRRWFWTRPRQSR